MRDRTSHRVSWAGVREVLAYTDVFLPNEAELAAVTGIADPASAAAQLTARGTTVVLKQGAAGAQAWWPDGTCRAPGIAVSVVDTTGAGDSFDAGFLAGRLRGLPIQQCLAMAVAAGSLSTRAAGGTAAQPGEAELVAVLSGASTR